MKLELCTLSGGYGAKLVIDGVSLTIRDRSIVTLLGPNGCGKSTLLHLIGGVDRPTSGKVIIDNEDIYKLKEEKLAIFRRRKIGVCKMRTEKREQKENFIQKIIRKHKIKEEKRLKAQLNFLFNQVFQYYYDLVKPTVSGVDLPEFIYERERREQAERRTVEELLYRVADKKTVEKLCKKRANQLKKVGIKVTL